MDLNARVARLERRNRLLMGMVALLAAPAAFGLLYPRLNAADDKASSLEVAERLVLRNANGVVAATLVAAPTGGSLSLCDAAGRPRAVVAVGKDGPSLVFLDGNQSTANRGVRLAASANEKSGPSVSLFGQNSPTPLASVRTKPASGSSSASGVVVAVNEDNHPVAFPRSTRHADADEPAPGAAQTKQ